MKFNIDSVAITVLDTTKPTLNLSQDTLGFSQWYGKFNLCTVNDNSTDNCGLDSATDKRLSAVNYTCADTGAHKVEVKLYDMSGNYSTDSVLVFIADTISPTYTKLPFTASLLGSSATVSRADVLSNISAGCFPPVVSFLTDTVYTCADVSSSPNYLKFSFASGTVNVIDSVAITVIDTVNLR